VRNLFRNRNAGNVWGENIQIQTTNASIILAEMNYGLNKLTTIYHIKSTDWELHTYLPAICKPWLLLWICYEI